MFRIVFLFCLLCSPLCRAQVLKPVFDPEEYLGMLQRSAYQLDMAFPGPALSKDATFIRIYRAPETGMHNKWELWQNAAKTIMVIDLRGTTANADSWIENFYSAMIPATGSLKLSNNYTFKYKLAADPRATVHVGWTIGIGSMAADIVKKVQATYAEGTKQLIIEGHSQGGALSYLLTSYLHYLVVDGTLPGDLVIKTYCSAAPKPGNLYYAYDFDNITRGGWAYNVVNTADWVPETPFAIQTLKDINKVNPFMNLKDVLRKQNMLVRLYGAHLYNSMNRSSNKASRKFSKHLGKTICKQVKKYLPEYEQPKYVQSMNYARAGTAIVVAPGPDYYSKFPDTGSNIFRNHYFEPYRYLVQQAYK